MTEIIPEAAHLPNVEVPGGLQRLTGPTEKSDEGWEAFVILDV